MRKVKVVYKIALCILFVKMVSYMLYEVTLLLLGLLSLGLLYSIYILIFRRSYEISKGKIISIVPENLDVEEGHTKKPRMVNVEFEYNGSNYFIESKEYVDSQEQQSSGIDVFIYAKSPKKAKLKKYNLEQYLWAAVVIFLILFSYFLKSFL